MSLEVEETSEKEVGEEKRCVLWNIAKGIMDPGVDCFDQYFGLVGLVQYAS